MIAPSLTAHPSPGRRPGFLSGVTLMELLVAISVVGVLAVLLFSALEQIRNFSGLTTCTNNLRSLARAHALYAQEHNGHFTSARWDNPKTDTTNPGLRDYLDLTGTETAATVMTCPAIQQGDFPSHRPMRMNYSINTTATRNYHINSRESARKITAPGNYLLFTEGVVNPTLASAQTQPFNYFTTLSWAQKPTQQFIHQGRQNVLFMDGRVELLSPEAFPEGRNAYKEPIWWGSEY